MFKGHPWEGEEFGAVEYEWYLAGGYVFNVEFDVNMKPFLDFCKQNGHRINHLLMKIGSRLSCEFLPQRTVSLKKRDYPVRFPAGYVRLVKQGEDMLEHIGIEERGDGFKEFNLRELINPYQRYMMTRHSRITVFLAKRWFGAREAKKNYALMISRNPLRKMNTKVSFHGTHYRTYVLTIPFGEKVSITFGAPHALGNINFYEPFLLKFKTWMENPHSIPQELIEKKYQEAPSA